MLFAECVACTAEQWQLSTLFHHDSHKYHFDCLRIILSTTLEPATTDSSHVLLSATFIIPRAIRQYRLTTRHPAEFLNTPAIKPHRYETSQSNLIELTLAHVEFSSNESKPQGCCALSTSSKQIITLIRLRRAKTYDKTALPNRINTL